MGSLVRWKRARRDGSNLYAIAGVSTQIFFNIASIADSQYKASSPALDLSQTVLRRRYVMCGLTRGLREADEEA